MNTRNTQPVMHPTTAKGIAVITGASAGTGAEYVNRDALLETFAAELTAAAYRVALRTRTQGCLSSRFVAGCGQAWV